MDAKGLIAAIGKLLPGVYMQSLGFLIQLKLKKLHE